MSKTTNKFSPEVRERAVRMVVDSEKDHPSHLRRHQTRVLFFQLKYVAWLISVFRQTSATGVPSSPCLITNAFCASVNFDAFMPRLLAQPRKSEAENSSSNRSSFQEAEHDLRQPTFARAGASMTMGGRISEGLR